MVKGICPLFIHNPTVTATALGNRINCRRKY